MQDGSIRQIVVRALGTFLVPVVVAFVMRAVFGEVLRRRPSTDETGGTLLRVGWGARIPALFFAVGTPVGFGLLWLSFPPGPKRDMNLLGWASLAVMTAIGWLALVSCIRVWARISEDGIEAQSTFGAAQRVAWSDIREVGYSTLRGALVFHGASGECVRVPIMLVGLPALLEQLERRLPREMYEAAVSKGLQQLAGYRD